MTTIRCSDCGASFLGRPRPYEAHAVHKAVPGLCPGPPATAPRRPVVAR